MSHALYKDTTIARELVTQEARVILGPDPEAPIGSVRLVRVCVPSEPQVFVALDLNPDNIALNRVYNLPPMPPQVAVPLRLRPQQSITAATSQGNAVLTVIVEYLNADTA